MLFFHNNRTHQTQNVKKNINPESLSNQDLMSMWHNWTMQLKKIGVKTREMLSGDANFTTEFMKNNKPQIQYHIVIIDDQAKHIPVLQVMEWQKDGHLQASAAIVNDSTGLMSGVGPEQLASHINTQGKMDCYLLRISEIVDGVSGGGNLEILQFGTQAHSTIPYVLLTFAMLLEFTRLHFNCSSIHETLEKYPEFIKLCYDEELLYQLILKSLKQNPNSPFKTYMTAHNGDLNEFVLAFLEFYIPAFLNSHSNSIIDNLNIMIF